MNRNKHEEQKNREFNYNKDHHEYRGRSGTTEKEEVSDRHNPMNEHRQGHPSSVKNKKDSGWRDKEPIRKEPTIRKDPSRKEPKPGRYQG